MGKISYRIDIPFLKRCFSALIFIFLSAYIFCWPVINYIPSLTTLTNVFEYGFVALFFCGLPFYLTRIYRFRSIFIICFLFVIYILFVEFITLDFTKMTFNEWIIRIYPFLFLPSLVCVIDSRKKFITCLLIFLTSIYGMFAYSFFITPFAKIVQAFTGGGYRLGDAENQPNAYGNFCVIAMIISIFLCLIFRKKTILTLSVLPAAMSFGSQSKKANLCVFLLLALIVYIFAVNIQKKSFRILFYGFLASAVFIVGFLLFKFNVLNRLLILLLSVGSDASRPAMFQLAWKDSGAAFFFGHGSTYFRNFFFINSGLSYVFHSTLGDYFYSFGFLGLCLWLLILAFCFLPNKFSKHKSFVIVALICQIIFDAAGRVDLFRPQIFLICSFLLINNLPYCYPIRMSHSYFCLSKGFFRI